MSARTHDGRSVRLLNLIDESTRECLLIRAERRWSSAKVIGALADSVEEVIDLEPDQIQPAPRIGTQIDRKSVV